jgi:hypothetical protein
MLFPEGPLKLISLTLLTPGIAILDEELVVSGEAELAKLGVELAESVGVLVTSVPVEQAANDIAITEINNVFV